jgi:two-component system OmpR family response regulator
MLLLDDEPTLLRALQSYFRSHGYEVDAASQLADGQALLAVSDYDVVIADLRLDGNHGTEGLAAVSMVRERHPDTAVVMLSAYGSDEVRQEAARRGADAFLSKPQRLADLARLVDGLLAERRRRGEHASAP